MMRWLTRRPREESNMTYGPQGSPVTVRQDEDQPQQPLANTGVPEQQPVIEQSKAPEPAAPAEPQPEPQSVDERLAEAIALNEVLQGKVIAATALVTQWDNRASHLLVKSEYQQGQRDNTFACINDLRGALGIA